MVHSNNFVVSIKSNGKYLREFRDGGTVETYIPFGSEYSVYLKNLDARKAKVSITVDGREVIKDLVVYGNNSMEIERFF